MRESSVEAKFNALVKAMGGISVKIAPIAAGAPDRFVLLPGGWFELVELKAKGGRLREIQKVWHSRAAAIGTPVTVLTGPEEVERWATARRKEMGS